MWWLTLTLRNLAMAISRYRTGAAFAEENLNKHGDDEIAVVTRAVCGMVGEISALAERVEGQPALDPLTGLLNGSAAYGVQLGPLARQIGGRLQTLAFTATADAPTRGDIVEKLFAAPPRVFVRSFDRPNLRLAFKPKERSTRQVLSFVQAHPGSRWFFKCWPAEKNAELIGRLSDARGRQSWTRQAEPRSANASSARWARA